MSNVCVCVCVTNVRGKYPGKKQHPMKNILHYVGVNENFGPFLFLVFLHRGHCPPTLCHAA